jgi:hypothetical protein
VGVDYVKGVAVGGALAAVLVCLGAGFAATRGGVIAASVLCVISVVALIAVAVDKRYQRPDWRGALAAVAHPRNPAALVSSPGVPAGAMRYYYSGPLRQARQTERICGLTVVALATGNRSTLGTPAPPDLDPRTLGIPAGLVLVEQHRTDTFDLLRFSAPRPVTFRGDSVAAKMPNEPGTAYAQGSARARFRCGETVHRATA